MKKRQALAMVLTGLLYSCTGTNSIKQTTTQVNILPAPKLFKTTQKAVFYPDKVLAYTGHKQVLPILKVFRQELKKITGFSLELTSEEKDNAQLVFTLNPELAVEEYRITVENTIEVAGGSVRALAMARSTLLQIVFVKDGQLCFPVLKLEDRPDAAYRGLLLDLARSWHDIGTIKKIIDLASFYKSNYLQLHFTDYQSYTLPSKKYPKLPTPDRHYSFQELKELEEYASARGVIIVPEIDIPGHSSAIVKAYPEIFAIKDIEANPWIINMGKEQVYQALESIVSEIAPIFQSSPYFHIGGDEAIFHKTMDDPDVKKYIREQGLQPDVHELYRHFLARMNQIVKKQGKKMCVWEGFRREGHIQIPKDILVFEFETNRYLPDQLVEDGYEVVNTSWRPLYVVNEKKWEPKTIYNWNMWRWENWFNKAPSFEPIQLAKTPRVVGAQMCAWEQAQELQFKSLRKRLPTMNERIWNTDSVQGFNQFVQVLEKTDQILSQLMNDDEQDDMLYDYNFEEKSK